MRISRDIEYTLYKRAELRQRAAQVAGLLLRGPNPVTALVRGLPGKSTACFSAHRRPARAARGARSSSMCSVF
ncbi:hypothetical protein [Thermomonas sp.]